LNANGPATRRSGRSTRGGGRPSGPRLAWLALAALAAGSGCASLDLLDRDDPGPPAAASEADAGTSTDDDDGPAGGPGEGEGEGSDPADPTGGWPNAQDPGPDLANFPNSAFVIPKGKFYVELAPSGFSGPTDDTGPMFNTDFLLRYGLTRKAEFRIFGQGYSNVFRGQGRASGFAPIGFDLKMNLWDLSDEVLFLPSVGVEGYVLTEFGSSAFNAGVQPSLSLLFDHTLPGEINVEWNIGLSAGQEDPGPGDYRPDWNFQWAVQRRFFDRLDLFTHGLISQAGLPRVGDGIVVGGGAIWSINPKWTLFGSYNAGVDPEAPTTFAQLGFLRAL
jgi:hypothetical protein